MKYKIKYKFKEGEIVKIKGMEEEGKVLDRRFLFTNHLEGYLLPGIYYTVLLLEEEKILDDEKERLGKFRKDYPERKLEKITSNN